MALLPRVTTIPPCTGGGCNVTVNQYCNGGGPTPPPTTENYLERVITDGVIFGVAGTPIDNIIVDGITVPGPFKIVTVDGISITW